MRRPTSRVRPAVLAAVLLGLAGACQPAPAPAIKGKVQTSGPAPRSITEYKLVGVVRNVDPKTSRVTIRHEAIPGFMDAMTMPFTLHDSKDLDDVRPGDEVEGTLRVEKAGGEVVDYELKDLVVSNPAPAAPLSLSLAGGQASVGPVPQVLKPGDMVPDFTMTDQEGATRKLSDFRGHVVALTFIFTRCPLPDFCPKMDRKFAEVADRVGAVREHADQIRLLSVSFDPAHDTPAVLTTHAKQLGATSPLWTFAVASHDELARVARPLGLVYGPGRNDEMIHNLVIAVIDPDGRLVRLETGEAARSWETADLIKSMYSRVVRPKKS